MTKQHAYTQRRDITPTVDTSAYADLDNIGGTEYQLENVVNQGAGLVLQTVTVVDLAAQESALTLLFFNAEPENSTFTDNAAQTIADADMPYYCGYLSIAATDYLSLTGNSVASVENIGMSMELLEGDLWVVVVSAGTPTYAAATDLRIALTFWQD